MKVSLLLLLDMSAVFDTVDIKTLLNIFEHVFNISGECLKWITSYLSNQSKAVIVNNIKSKSFNLTFGVLRGSCIGPIAFVVYISHFYEITKKLEKTSGDIPMIIRQLYILYQQQKTKKVPCKAWRMCQSNYTYPLNT